MGTMCVFQSEIIVSEKENMNTVYAHDMLLGAMKEHELVIGQLYKVYARLFPEYCDFWNDLSNEEELHAQAIDVLNDNIKNSEVDFMVDRFPIAAIETSIKYIRQLIERAKQPDLPLVTALSLAVDIEKSLLENRYFEIFEGDSPKTKHALTLLESGTQKHLKIVQQMLQNLK